MKEYPKQIESYIGKEVIVWMTDNKEKYYLGTIVRKDKGPLGHTIFKLENKQIVFSTEVHSWDYVSNEDEYYEEILTNYKFPIQNRDYINKKVIITLFNDETKKATTVRWDVNSDIAVFQTEDNKFYLSKETQRWNYIKEEKSEEYNFDYVDENSDVNTYNICFINNTYKEIKTKTDLIDFCKTFLVPRDRKLDVMFIEEIIINFSEVLYIEKIS